MDLTLLQTLRQKLLTTTEFSDVFDYFYDHFGGSMEFMNASEPTQDELLLELIGKIGGALFKTSAIRLDGFLLLRIAQYHFIHGGMTINGAPANVIYFDDIKKGMILIHAKIGENNTHCARFSADMIAPNLAAQATKFKH